MGGLDWTVLIRAERESGRKLRRRGWGEGTFLKSSSVRQLAAADNHKTTGALEVWVLHG